MANRFKLVRPTDGAGKPAGGRKGKLLPKDLLMKVLAFALAAGMLAATGLAAVPSSTGASVEAVGEEP